MIYALVLGEFIALCILAVQVGRLSEKVIVLKDDNEYCLGHLRHLYSLVSPIEIKELSFKKKIKKEENRMNYADDSVHGPNHRWTTPDMEQKKKNHIYYMRSKAKKSKSTKK